MSRISGPGISEVYLKSFALAETTMETTVKTTIDTATLDATIAETVAARQRKQLSKWLGSAAAWCLLMGIVGFIPAIATFVTTRHWYVDAISRLNYPYTVMAEQKWGQLWDVTLAIHVATSLCWTFLACHQLGTGATGAPGGTRRRWHRRMGYVAATLALLVASEAIFLQLLKPFYFDPYSLSVALPILTVGSFIFLNVINGIRNNAHLKRYAQHKVAMAWACLWTGSPGGVRVSIYLFLSIGGCTIPNFKGIVALGSTLMAAPVVAALWVVRRNRAFSWLDRANAVAIVMAFVVDIAAVIWRTAIDQQCRRPRS